MSPDERVAATEDAMKELQGVRDTKKQSPQNVPSTLSVLHDVRKTLRRIEDEVRVERILRFLTLCVTFQLLKCI